MSVNWYLKYHFYDVNEIYLMRKVRKGELINMKISFSYENPYLAYFASEDVWPGDLTFQFLQITTTSYLDNTFNTASR